MRGPPWGAWSILKQFEGRHRFLNFCCLDIWMFHIGLRGSGLYWLNHAHLLPEITTLLTGQCLNRSGGAKFQLDICKESASLQLHRMAMLQCEFVFLLIVIQMGLGSSFT